MIARVRSATLVGVQGRRIVVEVHVSAGLPGFHVVGLPDAACREARDRVRSALLSSGLPWPLRRVTVNLAPSGLRKSGSGLDLPIAVGLLAAQGLVPEHALDECGFLGELGLDGSLRDVPGVAPLVAAMGTPGVVLPAASAPEAALLGSNQVRCASALASLVEALRGERPWDPLPVVKSLPTPPEPDLAEVKGQLLGRRALEVAAAGGHHMLMIGPPGAGKSMLAQRLPGLLPDLSSDEALEATMVRSAAGRSGYPGHRPPFRAPHHSSSLASLLGGGGPWPRPGEVSLAHRGVLFLDELGEFSVAVLDSLRQPLEEGVLRLAKGGGSVTLPACFLLAAAMNPCPCGMGGTPGACRCGAAARTRYARRVSGPLLDRFDIRIPLWPPDPSQLLADDRGESSAEVAARVAKARSRAAARGVSSNAALAGGQLEELAPLSAAARALLERKLRSGTISPRGLQRLRRVARTVADLEDAGEVVEDSHVAMALGLRVGLEALAPGLAA